VRKTPRPYDEEPGTAVAAADLMGDRLRNDAMCDREPAFYFNALIEWCLTNSPDGKSLVLAQPTLCDARVIDVGQFRNFVALAMDMVELIDDDEVNPVRPPHAQLIAELCEYKEFDELQAEEIDIIIEYDGVITYDIDNNNILGVTIGFYTIPVSRDESKRSHEPMKNVDIVRKSTGDVIPIQQQMSLEIMGDFVRHDRSMTPASKALDVRSKRVHDLYTQPEKSMNSNGQANCMTRFEQSAIACGFLHEGADEICHAAQLEGLSEVVQHFYPERDLPTNKQEYKDKVRSVAEIVEDLWFHKEGG
jgi:hypothetical protein